MKTNDNQKAMSVIEVQDCTIVGNPPKSEDKSTSLMCKKVTIEGIAGIVFGTLGTATAALGFSSTSTGSETPQPEPTQESVESTEDVASTSVVNDDMSFGEAFAAARAELGSGGTFEWHGNVYGTCYADEWEKMDETEQTEIVEQLQDIEGFLPVNEEVEADEPKEEPTEDIVATEEVVATVDTDSKEDVVVEEELVPIKESIATVGEDVDDASDDISEQEVMDVTADNDGPVVIDAQQEDANGEDAEVTILGIDRDIDPFGNKITAVVTEEKDEIVSYFDADGDGVIDFKATDTNENGYFEKSERVDIQDKGIQVADFEHQLNIQEGIEDLEENISESTEEQIMDQQINQMDLYADGSDAMLNANPDDMNV